MSNLETAFQQEMLNSYHEAVKLGYRPARLFQMINELGGVETARRILAMDGVSEGMTRLWELGRLDLAAQALALKPAYAALFTEEEREKARRTLAEYSYTPPWVDPDKPDSKTALSSPSTTPAPPVQRPQNGTRSNAGASSQEQTRSVPATPAPPVQRPQNGTRSNAGASSQDHTHHGLQRSAPAEQSVPNFTGSEVDVSGQDQICIVLQAMVKHGGTATMPQIYNAVATHMGKQLSEQGRASLRFFVNKVAVERGLVYPHDPDNPGWRITPEGRALLDLPAEEEEKEKTAMDDEPAHRAHSQNDQEQFYIPDELDRLIVSFRRSYLSFKDQRYLDDERTYKLKAAEQLHTLLSQERLQELMWAGRLEDAKTTIRHACQGTFFITPTLKVTNNLLNQWDMLPILNAPAEPLTRCLYDLLYGTAPFDQRFDAWVELLSADNSRCWPAATYFLMLQYPEHHVFVKPEPYRTLLKQLNSDLTWEVHPSAAFYQRLQALGKSLLAGLLSLDAQDMIDVQSFVWVIHQQAGKEPTDTADAAQDVQVPIPESDAPPRMLATADPANDVQVPVPESDAPPRMLATADPANDLPVSAPQGDTLSRMGDGVTTRTPTMHDTPTTAFWRIHFPSELWKKAREHEVIGIEFPLESTDPSVRRLKRVKVGDRVVAYLKGGSIGGIGVVTHAYTDIRAGSDASSPADPFSGRFPQRIGVAWSEESKLPTPPIFANYLKTSDLLLYNYLVGNTRAFVSIQRDHYVRLLSLLGIDDAKIVSPPSTPAWICLRTCLEAAQHLAHGTYTPEQMLSAVQHVVPDLTDEDELFTTLRQLRLLASDGQSYRLQPYLSATALPFLSSASETGLLRLTVLAFLYPSAGSAEIYTLPARTIVPRLRATSTPQLIASFAPELGADGPRLLSWYAEAGIVTFNAEHTTWQPATDALNPLPGDDPATQIYNDFLYTLLAELDGNLIQDLPAIQNRPLQPVPDFDACLREFGNELLIDPQIIRRIYRSLLAGRHVVLSGPPGTGKTELARCLPTLLWREQPQTFRRLTTDPDKPPVEEVSKERLGYAPILVTATEDWGVRDVVGGISPRLDDTVSTLSYVIEHGHLTRTVLQHYVGTDQGRKLPPSHSVERQDYYENATRYRGAWLIIDEFTRAPIDTAFGSLLTTLSGGSDAVLAVPAPSGDVRRIPIPPDFRIIGTLNSFDRHFLNQISEAMKRRFDFIDVLPPHPRFAAYEQGIAVKKALERLHNNDFTTITRGEGTPASYHWNGIVAAIPTTTPDGMQGYTCESSSDDSHAALESFWRLFTVIRVFRQLGTAQAVSVYTNLFMGVLVGMSWVESLDTALADTLADQLQVLTHDEQRLLEAYIEHAGNAVSFIGAVRAIIKAMTAGGRAAFFHALQETDNLRYGSSDINMQAATTTLNDTQPTDEQIIRIFDPAQPLIMPPRGAFQCRLQALVGERGL